MSLETGHQHSRLQKSQSFGYNTSSGVTSVQSRADKAVKSRSSSREDLVRDQKMFQRQKHGVDPLASLPTSHSRQYQICTMHTLYLCLYYKRMKNYKRAGTGCPRQVAQGAFKWTAQLCMKELCKISCSPRRWSRDLTTVADPVQSPMSKIMSISRTFSPQQSNLGMFPLSKNFF